MLSFGEYSLVETKAPDGYLALEKAVQIVVSGSGVRAMQSGNDSVVNHITDDDADIWEVEVWDSAGVELPSCGGCGTTWIYLLGALFILSILCLRFLITKSLSTEE